MDWAAALSARCRGTLATDLDRTPTLGAVLKYREDTARARRPG